MGGGCWTKGDTCARFEPCTAFWPNVWKLENAAASAAIPNTPSRNFWPPARTNAGPWDITKLKGPVKWSYFYLYVILDIFSRYVVGWMVATQESSRLAKVLIAQSYSKQEIVAGGLTLHADRGSSMSSKALALLLADLGVTKSHSRPHVCDDNPYSESQFKTLKYRPEFPARFGTIQQARDFCRDFFDWYNRDHRHSGIGLHTPEDVHYLTAITTRRDRSQTLEAAHALFPERFPNGKPVPPALPEAVWINPPEKEDS